MKHYIVPGLSLLAIVASITLPSIFIPWFLVSFFTVLGTFLVLVLAIVLTIFVYLLIDNHKRFLSDFWYRVIFFIALFIIGFVLRVACALIVNPDFTTDWLSALTKGFQTFYFTVAGIGFEGQDISVADLAVNNPSVLWCTVMYFASMLWLAGSYISIITAGVSYGAYSFFLKILYCWFGRRSEYYIFTTLSEDSLNFADNIRNKKGKKCYVVFAGTELEKFDNYNELHKKVKARKYPYIVLAKKQVQDENGEFHLAKKAFRNKVKFTSNSFHNSVLLELGLLTPSHLKKASFHVFALQMDEHLKGLESANSDTVFDDIEGNIYHPKFYHRVLKNYFVNDNDNPYFHIDYYVLTNNTMNFEFYQQNTRSICEEYVRGLKEAADGLKKDYPALEKECENLESSITASKVANLFKINLVNEAYLAGLSFIEKRHEVEKERIKEFGKINYNGKDDDKEYVAIFLGFGQTGQVALTNLFVDTTTVNLGKDEKSTGEPSRFIAHVYDEKIIDYAGQFEKNHPSFLIADADEKNHISKEIADFMDKNSEINEKNKAEFNALLKKHKDNHDTVNFANEESLRKYYGDFKHFDVIDQYMKFPYIFLHKKNCNSLSLLRQIDNSNFTQEKAKNPLEWRKANAIVIALGDDETNIMTANAILQDIRQEIYSSYDKEEEKHHFSDIYVNIRDGKNRKRLNWNEELEKEIHPNIRVMPFGDCEELYSFESIINNYMIEALDSNYTLTGSSDKNFKFIREDKRDISLQEIKKVFKETTSNLDSLLSIEGFLRCVKKKDYVSYHNEFKNAFIHLFDLAIDEENKKQVFNAVFTRDYQDFNALVLSKTINKAKGDWKLNDDVTSKALKEHARKFAETNLSFDNYASIMIALATFALLKKNPENDQYLLDLASFKESFPQVYPLVASRKMKEVGKNRREQIVNKNNDKETNYDLLFRNIAKSLRSFKLDHYKTDSSRFVLQFLVYYDAFFEHYKNEQRNDVLDWLTRNYLGQLEHVRWSRYMMARGTVFSKSMIDKNPTNYQGNLDASPIRNNTGIDDVNYGKQYIKIHKDLVPYICHMPNDEKDYLADYLEIYDYINALCASFMLRVKSGE